MGSQEAAASLAYLSQDKSLGPVLLLLPEARCERHHSLHVLYDQLHLRLQPKTLYLQTKLVYAQEVFLVGALGVSLGLA
jgi:hypothetical protein